MRKQSDHLGRRAFVTLAGVAAAGLRPAAASAAVSLFDGKTLEGWIQIENSATALWTGAITDPPAVVAKLANGSDAVSGFLRSRLQNSVKSDLANYSASNPNAKAVLSALVKDLNQVIAGPSIYDKAAFPRSFCAPSLRACSNRIRPANNSRVSTSSCSKTPTPRSWRRASPRAGW